MKQVKHNIKLSLVSGRDISPITGGYEYVLRADIEQAQHSHSVRLEVSENEVGVPSIRVDNKRLAIMTPDQKTAAGLGGFSTQEVYDAVETFLAGVKE